MNVRPGDIFTLKKDMKHEYPTDYVYIQIKKAQLGFYYVTLLGDTPKIIHEIKLLKEQYIEKHRLWNHYEISLKYTFKNL